jgi:tetratricopeptide (TPR) repeat protein
MKHAQPDIAALQQLLNQAIARHKAGDLDAAERGYKSILERAPSQPDALNLLGVIQAERNHNDFAIELISKAIRIEPKQALYYNNLGRACVRARRFSEALEPLQRAISLAPGLSEAYGNLVQAHRNLGHYDETMYFIEELRCLKGGSITADFEEARFWSDWGHGEKATQLLNGIINTMPDHAFAWHALARSSKTTSREPLDRLTDLISKTEEPSSSMKFFCYAAGKMADDLGCFEEAFRFFLRAKAQDPHIYDGRKTKAHFESIKSVFNHRFFEERAGFGTDSSRPVFIVGMPRSGTTLAEHVLSAHPAISAGGELEAIGRLTGGLGELVKSGKYPEAARHLSKGSVASLAFGYLRDLQSINNQTPYLTDKMPHNFLSLGLIHLMFPRAKIVHCVRHPYDTCLSCFTHDFAHTHSYNRSLKSLAEYYNFYRDLMAHWTGLFGDQIFELNYDDYVRNPEAVSRSLFEFMDLEWADSVNNTAANTRRVSTPSSWQVRQPLYKTSSGRWENYRHQLLPDLEEISERWRA